MQVDISPNVAHQRMLVAEALPTLEAFIIIGRRTVNSELSRNFASCSFSEVDLANAVANFLIANPTCVKPFAAGINAACSFYANDVKPD